MGNDEEVQEEETDAEYFNPRSRVGNDKIERQISQMENISIHVPAWGTTCIHHAFVLVFKISIHVPAWGTTEEQQLRKSLQYIFQSTFPRGERPWGVREIRAR